jgi:hypothetical protein
MTMVVMTVLIDDPAEYQIMICLMTVVFRIILTKIKKLAMRSMMVPHADHYHRQPSRALIKAPEARKCAFLI